MKNGLFINPIPNSLSDLQNNYNYLITKEYKLNESNLSKSPSITIDDIKAGSTIVEISLKVNSVFTSNKNAAIEIVTDSGETLFSKNINDMNVTGTYRSDCYYKTNGNENEININHTLYSIPGKFVTVAYNNKYFAYSTDGINWTEGTISSTSRYWQSICYGNDKFVVVAYQSNYFAYSTDGINWTEGTISSTKRWWWSVCYGNGKFVAVAYNTNYFAYSTDGINWIEGTISDISSTGGEWNSVCYGNGKFVAVASSKVFAYSTDGINWTEGTISKTSRSWYSVCCSNNSAPISYGDATLMIEIFENIPEYNELLTSENEIYTTSNNIITEVTK